MENCIPVDKELKKGSGVFIYLDTKNECLKEPAEGVYKVWCSYKGDITVWQGNKGKWENSELEGLQITPSVVSGGYELAFYHSFKSFI